MTVPAIRVVGLWKDYVIGAAAGTQTFREALTEAFTVPFRRLGRGATEGQAERRFWALQNVSFDVRPGEVVGIIGRNGAGKSTLLKILSRITAPTRGEVHILGRIASLLEVGTGFHPELTGRENIRLNGAILGMSGAEIRSKLDEIVAFAGIETNDVVLEPLQFGQNQSRAINNSDTEDVAANATCRAVENADAKRFLDFFHALGQCGLGNSERTSRFRNALMLGNRNDDT